MTKSRTNGIYERGENTWALVIDLPKGPEGKRKQKWHTFKGSKAEAVKERTRLLHELNTGTYVEPSKMTVAEWLTDWLENYARINATESTYSAYRMSVNAHLIPGLGHIKLSDLKPPQLQQFFSRLSFDGRRDGKGGLSPVSLQLIRSVLRSALQQAVVSEVIARNPASGRRVILPKKETKEMPALTPEQVDVLMSKATGYMRLGVFIAVTCGLRRGEVFGLRWEDVDLDHHKLSVQQSATIHKAKRFKSPKTANSRRCISLPDVTAQALRKHRVEQIARKVRYGSEYKDSGLVCSHANGTPIYPGTVSRNFAKLAEEVGMPGLRFHDLRHTHATHLLMLRVPIKVISQRLGHANTIITNQIYGHVLPEMEDDVARDVDELFSKRVSGK